MKNADGRQERRAKRNFLYIFSKKCAFVDLNHYICSVVYDFGMLTPALNTKSKE